MQRRRGVLGATTATVCVLLLVALPAHSITLFKFKGTVRDAIGRALAAATVNDGTDSTTTASNGTYTLPEDSTGRYTLNSFRSDTVTTTKVVDVTVPLDQTVDFTLYYKISGVLVRSALSTATGPNSTTLTVTSSAPNPGAPGQSGGKSCVYVTDSRTGQATLATYESTNQTTGASTWTYPLALPQGTPEGSYQLALTAKDCASGTVLTATPSPAATYVVDNTAPIIDPSTLVPADYGNTVFASQPLLVKISDVGGSSLDPTTIRFTLTNETTEQTTVYSGSSVSYTSSSRWAKTNPATMMAGHRYRMGIEAYDTAGNAAPSVQGLFNSIRVAVSSPGATSRIPPTAAKSMSTSGLNRTFKFESVPLDLTEYSAVVTGPSRHGGFGYIRQTVDLTKAKIRLYNNTVELVGSPFNAPAVWGTRATYGQIIATDLTSVTQTIPIQPVLLTIPTLTYTTSLPANKAVVELSAPTAASIPACSDPSVGCSSVTYPTPDPLPYFMLSAEAERLNTHWVEATRQTTTGFGIPVCAGVGANPCRLPDISDYAKGLVHLSYVVGGKWAFAAALTPYDVQLASGVTYATGYPVILPSAHSAACAAWSMCSMSARMQIEPEYTTTSNGDQTVICVDEDQNQVDDNCHQYVTIWVDEHDPARDYTGDPLDTCSMYPSLLVCTNPQYHVFTGGMFATYGFNDGDKDEVLLGANTGADKLDPQWFGGRDQFSVTWRDYVRTSGYPLSEEGCYIKQNAFISKSGALAEDIVAAGNWPDDDGGNGYTGVKHSNLRQWTQIGGDGTPCDKALFNRLDATQILEVFFSDRYYGNKESILATIYGHRKVGDEWDFACGPAIAFGKPPIPYGCGWEQQATETQVWQAPAWTNFQW